MQIERMVIEKNQILLHTPGGMRTYPSEIAGSGLFRDLLLRFIGELKAEDSLIAEAIGEDFKSEQGLKRFIEMIVRLQRNTLGDVAKLVVGGETYLAPGKRQALHRFVEAFYDYWRRFDRYVILHASPGPISHEHRPYRAFNATVDAFGEVIRGLYRDLCENITGDHPRVYRQVASGANVGLIAVPKTLRLPSPYRDALEGIPLIRQVLINPPLILDPPVNKRSGDFVRVAENPLAFMPLDKQSYLCYPVQVGPLCILVYFHQRFISLACSMANLFELANEEQLSRAPDAVFVYGAPKEVHERLGMGANIFYDDEAKGLVAGFIPLDENCGYFGYVKKMVLTLHNVVMMKRGRMPFHGAMTRLHLHNRQSATLLLIGDTATGKSETLEALRLLGKSEIRDIMVIADDMGSLAVGDGGRVVGYGTETGAFIRLDDLQQGYAFNQIGRAIIMSPHRTNARVVLPVTTLEEILRGCEVDFLLYANNYEAVDQAHPILERFATAEDALAVFERGTSMSKGTTTSSGLVSNYFANIFGPPQYKPQHDALARRTFEAAFASGAYVGQLRTRLGLPGFEQEGPKAASEALLKLIKEKKTP
ncbi:MAG: phosphoenolpyruvate carboxykinase [Myxococcales bacterium]|nr:MAG: phosphoenolpyruvate carboxykinase [Myxococcales bacterium]